jgi:RNA polymerase sigma-70 factor, ECF subfamily
VHVGMTARIFSHFQHSTPLARGITDFAASGSDACATAETFVHLYERFRQPIHSHVYRLLGNREDADDVTQEVWVRTYIAWDELYDHGHLSAWLYRIATNACVDLLRRRARIHWWSIERGDRQNEGADNRTDEASFSFLSDTGGIPEVGEREHIRLALARMPRKYAIALVLYAAQGVPYHEIAIIVGISANAAATRISRAEKVFAEEYQRFKIEALEREEKYDETRA